MQKKCRIEALTQKITNKHYVIPDKQYTVSPLRQSLYILFQMHPRMEVKVCKLRAVLQSAVSVKNLLSAQGYSPQLTWAHIELDNEKTEWGS